MTPIAKEQHYTLADLMEWDDDKRYELYDGQPVAMASPSNAHQRVGGELFRQLATYLLGKRCKVYQAPFDVQLFAGKDDPPESISTVVQPDISIVCDPEKTSGHGCKGAPDMVVEVLSPSTERYDRLLKFNLYWQAGVREYWIVDPDNRMVSVHTLKDGTYRTTVYGEDSTVKVSVLDDCTIDLSLVFPEA